MFLTFKFEYRLHCESYALIWYILNTKNTDATIISSWIVKDFSIFSHIPNDKRFLFWRKKFSKPSKSVFFNNDKTGKKKGAVTKDTRKLKEFFLLFCNSYYKESWRMQTETLHVSWFNTLSCGEIKAVCSKTKAYGTVGYPYHGHKFYEEYF